MLFASQPILKLRTFALYGVRGTSGGSGVNGSVTLGMDWRKGEGILGDGSHPVGSRGEDPIGGLVDEPPSWYLVWKWI